MQTSDRKAVSSKQTGEKGLRDLPSISRLLASSPIRAQVRLWGTKLVTDLLRESIEDLRGLVRSGDIDPGRVKSRVSATALARSVRARAEELLAPRPRPVINATGVVVHTNLGRSLLSEEASQAVARLSRGYMDLEYDVERGERGSRMAHLEPLMRRLFPGHDFLIVNNNAAAIMLCLKVFAKSKDVLISRGELVEIGGSFRVPDILAASGGRLREVGTTNRTRLADYRGARTAKTGVVLKVHTSNFHIVGFTESVTIPSLSRWSRAEGLPLVVDWGSGDLVDLGPLGIHDEMPVNRVLEAGADLVTFSGDKLLGGPQAGFVVGRKELVARLRKDPLARVVRLDRLLIAALHQTLAAYVRGEAFERVPTLRMLAEPVSRIDRRAKSVVSKVARLTAKRKLIRVIDGVSRPGGGSSPGGELPTKLIAVESPSGDAGELGRRLREGDPPVIGRVQDGKLLLDLRTVSDEEEASLVECLVRVLASEMES